jgi:hypothetical protein
MQRSSRPAGSLGQPKGSENGGLWSLEPESGAPPNALSWWQSLTAPREVAADAPLADRERVRRGRLASILILGLLVIVLLTIPIGLTDPATRYGLLACFAACMLAIFLNRGGHVSASGSVLVIVLSGALLGAVVGAPHGQLDLIYVPLFDLLVLSELVAVTVLPPASVFIVALLNSGLITLDMLVQPATPAFRKVLDSPDFYTVVARPIVLQLIVAVVSYLWVRSASQALRRADRAEELAILERAVAEDRLKLESSARLLVDAHTRVANGDYNTRAQVPQGTILWQVGQSLNNLISRVQRAGQADFELQRTREEIARLAAALRDAQQGRQPIWPNYTQTAVDDLVEIISGRPRPSQLPQQPRYPRLGDSSAPPGGPPSFGA